MNRDRLFNFIGFGLISACFAVALLRIYVFSPERRALAAGGEVVRIAHWQLESGIREAVDQLARNYMERHPNVRVEQIAIPDRIYTSWLVTQLTGGTAPDLVQLGIGLNDERLARFFQPLSDVVQQPNPYNTGTRLEGVAWKDTFLDGLAQNPGFNTTLLEWYGVTMATLTTRLYYNRAMLQEIDGPGAEPPGDFAALLALAERVEAFNARTGRQVHTITASQQTSQIMLSQVVSALNQRLALERDVGLQFGFSAENLGREFVLGRMSLGEPTMRAAYTAMSELARHMMPGFSNLRREDANFAFLQRRALMIPGGSWDFRSFTDEAAFPVGIVRFPVPGPDDPRFPGVALGPGSEAATGTSIAFGLTRNSILPQRAIDFLHYMTSVEGNTTFTNISFWPPSVVGVEGPEVIRPFTPVVEGFPGSIGVDLTGMADMKRAQDRNLHILFRPRPGESTAEAVERYVVAYEAEARPNIIADLRRILAGGRRTSARNDTRILADMRGALRGDAEAQRELTLLLQQQLDADGGAYYTVDALQASGNSISP